MEYFTINQVAEKLKVTKHTLYFYEKEGLLPDIKRNKNNHRMFTQSDVSWIYLICCLRDIDMPVALIREYIQLVKDSNSSIAERKAFLLAFKSLIEEKMTRYMSISSLIEKKISYYEAECEKTEGHCLSYQDDWESFKEILEEGDYG